MFLKNEKIANRKLGKLGNLGKLFRVILFPSFRFCPTAKIENSDFKNLGKKFPSFPSFRPGREMCVVCCMLKNLVETKFQFNLFILFYFIIIL